MGQCASNAVGPNSTVAPRRVRARFPAKIVVVRHGQSRGNVDETEYSRVPDWKVALTDEGRQQARATGMQLHELLKEKGEAARLFVYCSPYMRCKQTLEEILNACGIDETSCVCREEPRIREQEFGNFQDPAAMEEYKEQRWQYGRFFYRFPSGESGADVYDRVSTWLESFYREMEFGGRIDENTVVLLCTHGLTGRLFLMRWFHWTVEEFEGTTNPPNAQLLVMERDDADSTPHPWSRVRYKLTLESQRAIGVVPQTLSQSSSGFWRPSAVGSVDSHWSIALEGDSSEDQMQDHHKSDRDPTPASPGVAVRVTDRDSPEMLRSPHKK